MTKKEITKEILISAFYLGKYLIKKHKLKKKQKLEEAVGFDFKMQCQIASETKQIFQEKLEELKAK